MLLRPLFSSSIALFLVSSAVFAQAPSGRPSAPRRIAWASPDKYIAGTDQSRLKALRKLHAERGRWVFAYFSIACNDCDRLARSLNAYAPREHILAVASAPADAVKRWSHDLGLTYPVVPVDDETLEQLGAVVFPTLVLFVDGRARGARCPAMEKRE